MPKFLANVDLAKNEIQNARVQNLSSAPSSPVTGQIYYDTGSNHLYYYNGSTWVQADGSSISFGTPSLTFSTTNSAGVATTAIRTDATLAIFDATAPSTSAAGDSAAAGSAGVAARRDHAHGRESFGSVSGAGAFGQANSDGAATTLARSSHVHSLPAHTTALHQEMLATNDLTDWPRTASLDLNNQTITNLADPVNATDAANKRYVDLYAGGFDFKASVKVATTAALAANTYANGTSGVGATLTANANGVIANIDGQTMAVTDRVLVKNEATAANNGIYTVTQLGDATHPYILTRATDADQGTELTAGALTYVESGTVNGQQQWIMSTTGAITIGTTAINWTQYSGASTATAGSGLTSSGNVFNVGAGTGIQVNADSVQIDPAYTGQTSITTLGTIATGTWQATAVGVLYGGTGSTTAAGARTNLGATGRATGTIGNGSLTAIDFTHSLSQQYVEVGVYDASTNVKVYPDITLKDANTVTITFATAPATNAYRVVVVG